MPSRGSGHGVPQERQQKNIIFTRKCVPEAMAGDPAQEKLQNKIVITWKCIPEARQGSPPRNGSRTRSFLPGNAFQRLWPGCPPGKALEQDRYYQEVPSRGSGQRVLAGREFHGTQGRARTKALTSRQNEKALGGPPLGLSGSLGPFSPLFWLFLGLPGIPRGRRRWMNLQSFHNDILGSNQGGVPGTSQLLCFSVFSAAGLTGFLFIIRSSKSSFRRCAFCTQLPKAREVTELTSWRGSPPTPHPGDWAKEGRGFRPP